jgi:Male sterility protein
MSNLMYKIPLHYSIIGDHPNTYTFSKALAEYVVDSEMDSIPTAIVRPPISID